MLVVHQLYMFEVGLLLQKAQKDLSQEKDLTGSGTKTQLRQAVSGCTVTWAKGQSLDQMWNLQANWLGLPEASYFDY